MKKKLSSLYCTFVPCKSFVSDFFIVEKTFAFYEKFLFSEEKTFAIFHFTILEGRNFRENGQKSRKLRKFQPAKVSAPKVGGNLFSKLSFGKDITNTRRRVSEKFHIFSLVTHHLTLIKSYSF